MNKHHWASRAFAAVAVISFSVAAQTSNSPPEPVDYASASSWLCRPDKQDVCGINMDATEILANGSTVTERWRLNPDAPIDCFYVYPTISNDPTPNSDLVASKDDEELATREQFARFGSQCRLFAPLYRQITIPALTGQVAPGDPNLAYGDVINAWNYYLANYNKGRGVVLIGHSQGARWLKKLAMEEIDGKPLQARLVSALLIGTGVVVPEGKDVGADFKNIPLCRTPGQAGCVISYASFRKTSPPPPDSRFGKSPTAGMMMGCTNPASLSGNGTALKIYFASNHKNMISFPSAPTPEPWLPSEGQIVTPYVTLPGLLTGKCVTNDRDSYLEVTINSTPSDKRTKDISGDIYVKGNVLTTWGIHVVDVNIALGNLVDIVAQQAATHLKR